jgi:hypothetical protein
MSSHLYVKVQKEKITLIEVEISVVVTGVESKEK